MGFIHFVLKEKINAVQVAEYECFLAFSPALRKNSFSQQQNQFDVI
jgi:hypothetical protein